MSLDKAAITAVILAGGQGRRMGGQDKGLIEFDGRLMIEILIERLLDQQLDILINAAHSNANIVRQVVWSTPSIFRSLWLILGESSCDSKCRNVGPSSSRRGTQVIERTIAKLHNAEIDYFGHNAFIHELIRGSPVYARLFSSDL